MEQENEELNEMTEAQFSEIFKRIDRNIRKIAVIAEVFAYSTLAALCIYVGAALAGGA
jgi:hypothetical protein